jgi:hypothetical protein
MCQGSHGEDVRTWSLQTSGGAAGLSGSLQSRRNLRHHAATKWFDEELGESWEVVAQYLGDKLTTVLNHYVRAGEDALRDSVGKLANL